MRTEGVGADVLISEPIAIVGIGCRFPGGASSPERYWQLLRTGTDAIREISPDRWDIGAYYDPDSRTPGKMSTRWAGLLDDIDQFDAEFFGIAPREAASMDPQQRLLLEVSWEALNDSGYPPESLGESDTGVFFAVYNSDYARLQFSRPSDINAHTSSGTSHGIAAGRLSYLLNLHGPSLAIDTACSSSLVAVHLACQSLRTGECSLALAGGASVLVTPEETISMSKWGMLAPDGRCKAFDARANGFVRGEGCGVIALKRLADALADGDRIHAVIRGSAVNQDGRSTALTAPNGLAQQAVLKKAFQNARVSPAQISYIEAHGTGTALGDPIEVEALAAVIGTPRPDGTVCRVGSVKANLGHLEAAAGIAGLIKVVLAMQRQTIPPLLHFQKLNPLISIGGTCLRIESGLVSWPEGEEPRLAGVSSFGFGGTNAHVVLEEAPRLPRDDNTAAEGSSGPWILPVSARTPAALIAFGRGYLDHLRMPDVSPAAVSDLCATTSLRRHHYPVRSAFVGATSDELGVKLQTFLDTNSHSGAGAPAQRSKVALVFCGHGTHWVGMGKKLLDREEVFRDSLHACDRAIRPIAGWSVIEELGAPEERSRLEQTEVFHPVLFALQTALAALWQSWGIVPAAVLGHSLGEIAAAHIAGVLPLSEATRIAVLRGRLMQAVEAGGGMAAVELSADQVRKLFKTIYPALCIAAVNGPRSTTVSGDEGDVDRLVAELMGRSVFARRLKVNRAFHSPAVAAAAGELSAKLQGLSPAQSSIPFFSTVDGRIRDGRTLNAEYWGRSIREPVQFAAATSAALDAACNVFLEVGPHPALAGALQQCADAASRKVTILASLRRGQDERTTLLQSLGSLYAAGGDIHWKALYPSAPRPVSLPNYPWQRERHWAAAAAGGSMESLEVARWPGREVRSPFLVPHILETIVSANQPEFVGQHRVCGVATVPATGLIDLALGAASHALPGNHPEAHFLVESFGIEQALCLAEEERRRVQIGFTNESNPSGSFRIVSQSAASANEYEDWTLHATGKVRLLSGTPFAEDSSWAAMTLAEARALCVEPVEAAAHFEELRKRGVTFGPQFRGVAGLWRTSGSALARIRFDPAGAPADANHIVHPALLDACLQTAAPTLPGEQGSDGFSYAYLPLTIEKLWLTRNLPATLWTFARLRPASAAGGDVIADFWIFTAAGTLTGAVQGLRLKRTERSRLESLIRPADSGWLYEVRWVSRALVRSEQGSMPGRRCRYLILADRSGVGAALAAKLEEGGAQCFLVSAGDSFRRANANEFEVGSESAADLRRLLMELKNSSSKWPHHVVHLWGLDVPPAAGSDSHALSEDQSQSCGTVLHLVRAMIATAGSPAPRLWLISQQATPLGEQGAVDPAQAPLAGLAATLALEHPDLRCTHVDLLSGSGESATVLDRFCDELTNDGRENRVALTPNGRFVARLKRVSAPSHSEVPESRNEQNLALRAASSGILEEVAWHNRPSRLLSAGEVEIEVSHAGLNFRDVLMALGVVPGKGDSLGGECSGRIVAVGSEVTHLHVGDEVMAFAVGGLTTRATVPARLVVGRPEKVGLEQAAGLPVIFLTALYALHRLAALQAEQRILIHAGAGGVGSAAIQLAQLRGAEIFATAGTPEKRALLKSWGVNHVFDSRSVKFAEEIRAIAGERGLDIVLNSLTGEFIPRSLGLLRPGGVFLELGKRELLDSAIVARQHEGVVYHVFDLADVALQDPGLIQELLRELAQLFDAGKLHLPPMKTYAAADAAAAFRQMAQGHHIGKIIISVKDGLSAVPGVKPELVRPGAAYVITGGLGALGRRVARWLLDRGATHVVLAGRRPPSEAVSQSLDELRASGVRIETVAVDVSDRLQLAAALEQIRAKSELRGVIHAAGALDDGTVNQMDWPRFLGVLRAKVDGAWNLHELTRSDPLDFFVLFSSAASVLGSVGQANYAAANAFLDGLAHYRRNRGLPALSMNWGAWGEAGMAANLSSVDRQRMQVRGMGLISSEDGCRALEEILVAARTQIVAVPADWERYAESLPSQIPPPLLEAVLGRAAARSHAATPPRETASLSVELAALPKSGRLAGVRSFVERQAAQALGLAGGKAFDPQQPLQELGLDSLMAVELRNALAAALGCSLSATLLFDYPTIDALARYLAHDILAIDIENSPKPASSDTDSNAAHSDIALMTEVEAESLLLAELDHPTKR